MVSSVFIKVLLVATVVVTLALSQNTNVNDQSNRRPPFRTRPQFRPPPPRSQRLRPQILRSRPSFRRPSERLDNEENIERLNSQPPPQQQNRPRRPQFPIGTNERIPIEIEPKEPIVKETPSPEGRLRFPDDNQRPERPAQPSRPQLAPIVRPARQQNAPPPTPPPGENQPPSLVQGHDLIFFSLPEDTPVGTEVYTLKGEDPEGSEVVYTISGDYFSVNKDTGVITLREPLDREKEKTLDVVITIQDEAFNLIPFRREIRVDDVNDNAPRFIESPYNFKVKETAPLSEVIFPSIALTDADSGSNGEVALYCRPEDNDQGVCDTFHVEAQELAPGSYVGLISLKKPLDFEERSTYNLILIAVDEGSPSLNATTSVLVEVIDVQDQSPFFVNAPYSTTVEENTPGGTTIFNILARDGDTGFPRELDLSLVGDTEGFFELESQGHDETGLHSAILKTSESRTLDREINTILSEGGLYAFQILAREIADDGSFGDQVSTNVTIVVTDKNDEIPVFNRDSFTVAIPEDVGPETPLPDLNMIVNDADLGLNAEYELRIQGDENSLGVFSVYPKRASGRTPVIIRVENPDRLDYEREGGNQFQFRVNALQGQQVLSSATVKVLVTDSNDNVPVFDQQVYHFRVPEDSAPGAPVGQIVATDADSGRFGQVVYALKGFGSEKFSVNEITGDISINSCGESVLYCLDFETQKRYSLTYTATDGGSQVTTTNVVIDVDDVNDNFPVFEESEYLRVVQENAMEFEQPLIVHASDTDGPTQGGGQVVYSIHSINTEAVVFDIDPISGEITFVQPARSEDTEDGRYDIVVRATDAGEPPLFSDARVTVKVGSEQNQRPRFSEPSYEATVNENAKPGHFVLQIDANDPDGPKDKLRYVIHSGAKDNFELDEETGKLSVSEDANLDIQDNGDIYEIKVQVVDQGIPFSQTGETTVTIYIKDVNNKKPRFETSGSYSEYVLESEPVGNAVFQVSAADEDRNADVKYSIVEPISARDKTGNTLQNRAAYDYSKAFSIDPDEGTILVNNPLSHNSAAVIILTIQAEDVNADPEFQNQTATAEVTFYIQAYQADSPQFASPWTPGEPTITFEVKEEQPVGTILFTLHARDPVNGQQISQFQKIAESDPNNLIDISPITGDVINNQILDFELIKEISFQVRAIAGQPGEERTSDAYVVIQLNDINDNAPIFEKQEYMVEIREDILPLSKVIQVQATDVDTGDFGEVVYALMGDGSEAFEIDPKDGTISVKVGPYGRSLIDRENMFQYFVTVLAHDMPNGGSGRRSAKSVVRIEILDVNDSPPSFLSPQFTSVIPENSAPGTFVLRVEAVDYDLGPYGEVRYKFPEGGQAFTDLFTIDSQSGDIRTAKILTGKGRKAPYILTVRALDNGEPELFSDTEVYITIGDVSSNDGVPEFIEPKVDEVAYIKENSRAGTKVFHVQAYDPDDPETSNGKIVYSLPDDGSIIRKKFQIDPNSGVLSTKVSLDREERSEYVVILNVHDLGSPPQQTSRLLKVVVEDVDDHAPVFNRQRNSVPVELEVVEELPVGTEIGRISAIDQDEGENAIIDYAIIDGNEDKIFNISVVDNEAVLALANRLDRERAEDHVITLKSFKPYERNVKSKQKKYEKAKMDEIQVRIVVNDIDDNPPQFVEHNMTFGVRVNAPVYSEIATLKAIDPDADSKQVFYSIENVTFVRPRTKTKEIIDDENIFIIDPVSGLLQTNKTLGRFADGFFNLVLKASNGPNQTEKGDFAKVLHSMEDYAKMRIYVLQDTELMKFVFDQGPNIVRQKIPEFKEEIEKIIPQPLKFHLYETEFYSKVDGSLDFGRTSSCFQLLKGDNVVDLKNSEDILDSSKHPDLKNIFDKYSVMSVERCSTLNPSRRIDWIQICLLIVALLIGVIALVAAIVLCCLYSNYKRTLRKNVPVKIVEAPVRAYVPASLPPGSIMAPSVAGSDGRYLHEWQESTLQMDAASYRSLPRQ